MQLQRGKVWETLSHTVMLGRQRVDTQEVVPGEGSQDPFLKCLSKFWKLECSRDSVITSAAEYDKVEL